MNKKIVIPRSEKPMKVQMAILGVLGIFLLVFTSQIFNGIDNLLSMDTSSITRIARWLVLIFLAISFYVVYANTKKLRYYATDDSIVIEKGLMGARQKKIYGLENVTGMNMDQSFFGARMGYGHITLDLSMMTKAEVVQLTNVENPEEVLQQLRKLTKK